MYVRKTVKSVVKLSNMIISARSIIAVQHATVTRNQFSRLRYTGWSCCHHRYTEGSRNGCSAILWDWKLYCQ